MRELLSLFTCGLSILVSGAQAQTTLQPRWRVQLPGQLHSISLQLKGIVLFANNQEITAIDEATGKPKWKTTLPPIQIFRFKQPLIALSGTSIAYARNGTSSFVNVLNLSTGAIQSTFEWKDREILGIDHVGSSWLVATRSKATGTVQLGSINLLTGEWQQKIPTQERTIQKDKYKIVGSELFQITKQSSLQHINLNDFEYPLTDPNRITQNDRKLWLMDQNTVLDIGTENFTDSTGMTMESLTERHFATYWTLGSAHPNGPLPQWTFQSKADVGPDVAFATDAIKYQGKLLLHAKDRLYQVTTNGPTIFTSQPMQKVFQVRSRLYGINSNKLFRYSKGAFHAIAQIPHPSDWIYPLQEGFVRVLVPRTNISITYEYFPIPKPQ